MPLTRVQPSAIDQTLTYTANTVSANTVVVSGVNILTQANTGFNPIVFLTAGM